MQGFARNMISNYDRLRGDAILFGARKGRPTLGGAMTKLQRAFRGKKAAGRLGLKTKTKTVLLQRRKKQSRQLVKSSSSGIASKSVFSLYHKPSYTAKLLKTVGAPNMYTSQRVGQTIGAYGFQASSLVPHISVDLLKIQAGNLGLNTGTVATSGSGRYVMDSYQSELMLTNATNSACEVEIYDIACKRDLLVENEEFIGGAISDYYPWNGLIGPIDAWRLGLAIANGANPASASDYHNYFGASPFDSQIFKNYFKVLKRTNVQMPCGASHSHWNFAKPNRVVEQSLYNDSKTFAKAGLTFFTMWVVKGYPINANGETVTATTSEVQLNYVNAVRTKYTRVLDSSQTCVTTDSLTTPASGDTEVFNTANGFIEIVKTLNSATP